MPIDLTPDQLQQLQELGLFDVPKPSKNISNFIQTPPKEIKIEHISSPITGQIRSSTNSSNHHVPLLPLLSLSGFTVISFGGLILFKSKDTASVLPSSVPVLPPQTFQITPTQVPKSIQHYLLASQQNFTQALSLQNSPSAAPDLNQMASLLNQAILTATDAIKQFPSDFRGYQQRASIYQALLDSQPQFLDSAIADYSKASDLNPANADFSRSLATLYAKKGDAASTLSYLAKTVALEPTKAQNFYDLAHLQQQTGLIPQALDTYNQLLPLISDSTQKQLVKSEINSLKQLASQNSLDQSLSSPSSTSNTTAPSPSISLPDNPNLIQAYSGSGLIIASPETAKDISVSSLSQSNSLSGSATLPANTASISMTNSQLSSTSQVYLTITKGGQNQSLQVLSRSKDSFTVGLDSPISNPIEFKWWIVNP